MERYKLKIPIDGEQVWVSAFVYDKTPVTELKVFHVSEDRVIGIFHCYDDAPQDQIEWIEEGKGATALAKIVGEQFDEFILPLLQRESLPPTPLVDDLDF